MKQQDIKVSGSDLQGLSLDISGPGTIRGIVEMTDGRPCRGSRSLFGAGN